MKNVSTMNNCAEHDQHDKQYQQYKKNIDEMEAPDIMQNTIDFLKKLSEILESLIKSDLSEDEKNTLNQFLANKKDYILKQILILHKTLIVNEQKDRTEEKDVCKS